MEQIAMFDLKKQYHKLKNEIDTAIQNVVASSDFIGGKPVEQFAESLGKFIGANVVPCGNGTDALQIAMMALRFEPGDEVIVPAFTHASSVEAISLLGLVPVFADVHEETFNLDVDKLEDLLSSNTVAIVAVHLFGQCAYMEPILEFAERHNLYVIEDVAHSIGAEYIFSDGTRKKAGAIGAVGCTSFFPSSNLGCYGDGGAVISDNQFLVDKMKLITNHGQRERYHHDILGVNSRLDTIQAAILEVKLKYINEAIERRREIAADYDTELNPIEELIIPLRAPHSTHTFQQYTVKVSGKRRDGLQKYLQQDNIASEIYYPLPLHLQKAFRREGVGEDSFPVAQKLANSVISLPIHSEMTGEQVSHVCTTIKKYFNG